MSSSTASSGLADATAAAPLSSSSGEASAASNQSTPSQQLPSTTNPADQMNAAAAAGVEPQNPFEQVAAAAAAASPAHSIAANVSIEQQQATPHQSPVCERTTVNPPISPERSVGGGGGGTSSSSSMPSTPAAPSIVITAPNLSPAPATPPLPNDSTPATSRVKPLHPRSAPVPTTAPPTSSSSSLGGGFSDGRPQTEHRRVLPRHHPTPQHQQHTPLHQPVFDDDENTEPSSEANTAEHAGIPPDAVAGSSFVRFLENTRRRLSTGHHRGDLDDDDYDLEGAVSEHGVLICGYLQKFGRNGKWQTRWFETDGECLTYYKSNKRTRPLATLDLEKVGAIDIDPDDNKGCSFTIQVLGRLYHLRAESRASCKDWVITLNRVKEARLQQGNVKLVTPPHFHHSHPFVDLLDQPSEEHITPRVVVVANRQRTRAVAESQEFDQLIRLEDDAVSSTNPADALSPYELHHRRSTLGTAVLARWTKRRSTLSRLGAKLAKWARSLRRYSCKEIEEASVHLDRYVHPPGHDDKRKSPTGAISCSQHEDDNSAAGGGDDRSLSGWIHKEATQQSSGSSDPDEGTNKPGGAETKLPKPAGPLREMSSGSEYDARRIL